MKKTQNRLILTFATVALCWAGTAGADSVSSNFEGGGDTEGWSGIGALLSQASDPGEGGVLQVTPDPPAEEGGTTDVEIEAPSSFLGDMLNFDGGSLSFRTNIFSAMETILTTTITGGAGNESVSVSFDNSSTTPPSVWQTLSAPLSASEWGTNPEKWENILSDVQSITFGFAAAPTEEPISFDDITLATGPLGSNFAPTPEPGTLVLLATGLAGMWAYRRRKSAA